MLVDSHCHLDFPEFAPQLDDVVARATDAGIARMVTISTRVRKFDEILAVAKRFDPVYCTVGTHPHNAKDETDVTADELCRLAEHPKVVGLGEAGLDFHYDNSPRDQQATSFRVHIDAARRTGLPLVIHTRSADEKTAEILDDEMGKGAFPFLLHCFSSGAALARKGIELGGYISFSGILTFKAAEELRDIARDAPEDRIMVETDAPFLAPVPYRGKTNEPAYVRHTAEMLASVRGVDQETIERTTSANFFRLFTRVSKPDGYVE
jgi:TatD DNase family protein